MRILVIGEFLASHAGGAEKSTLAIVNKMAQEGKKVTLLCGKPKRFKHSDQLNKLPSNITIHYLEVAFEQLPPFIRYWAIRVSGKRADSLNYDQFDEIIVYDLWGKALIASKLTAKTLSKISLYIRSEVDYLVYRNYQGGWKKWAWYFYFLIQLPFFTKYCRDTIKVARNGGCVIANSNFVRARVKKNLGAESRVEEPLIDIDNLKRNFSHNPQYITFIGDSKHKGIDIFYDLVAAFPNEKFKCIARNPPRNLKGLSNVLLTDWSDNPTEIYNEARLVIVPSQWEEAFGRVAREAYELHIPVLCSSVGGLIEAVRNDRDSLVGDYKSGPAWKTRIKEKLSRTD